MQTAVRILRYLLIALGVIVLGGLVGWYAFLHNRTASTAVVNVQRGLNVPAPFFGGGSGGTTQANITRSIGNALGFIASSSAVRGDLWQIERAPVAGMGFMNVGTSTVLRFAERATGFIMNADIGTRTVVRLTDTLVPKTYEAIFASNGMVIERTIEADGRVATSIGSIVFGTGTSATSSTAALKSIKLPSGIRQILFDPPGNSMLYSVESMEGTVVFSAKNNGTALKKLFTSPIGSWRLKWLESGIVVLFTGPADNVPGYAYRLEKDGTLRQLLGNIPGLTFLPKPGSRANIYGSARSGSLTLFGTSATASSSVFTLHTVADKCVWSSGKGAIAYCAVPMTPPAGQFLNDWYRGAVHTTDQWWKVDVDRGTAQMIYDPTAHYSVSLDVESPMIDGSGSYIAFINARDKSLWLLRVSPLKI